MKTAFTTLSILCLLLSYTSAGKQASAFAEDGRLYKYRLIDSPDVQQSGYPVDTVNHWLDDIENSELKQSLPDPAAQVATDFLKWYKANYEAFRNIRFVDTSQKYYSVNLTNCEQYLQQLKGSGYVSDNYIAKWHAYFEKHAEQYKTVRQTDGPPEGFEYDFVLHTQEIDETLHAIDALKITAYTVVDDAHRKVEIDVRPSNLTVLLSYKEGTGWLIDELN